MGAGDRIAPVRGADHADVLARALALRAAGRVPLVLDERVAPEAAAAQSDAAVRALDDLAARSPERAAQAAWAASTSGSTGAPRVVLRTDRSWAVGHVHVSAWLGLTPGEGLLVPVHPTSSMALNAAAFCAATGVRMRVPARARVRAEDLAPTPAAPAPAALHGTPAQLADVLDLLDDDAAPASALRVALVGGDRLPAGLRERAEAHGIRVVHYYGAAEASFVAVDPDGAGLRLLPGVDAETEDGLLLVRSDQLAEPDDSLLRLTAPDGADTAVPRWRPDGFLRTGDAAALDGRRLTLHGRADGVILTAGATVHASAVEEFLAGLRDGADPLASAVLVAGEPDARLGRRVVAWVEPASGRDPEDVLAALRAAARERLTPAARPRRWHAVDRLPRTPSGKVRRVPPGSVMDSGA